MLVYTYIYLSVPPSSSRTRDMATYNNTRTKQGHIFIRHRTPSAHINNKNKYLYRVAVQVCRFPGLETQVNDVGFDYDFRFPTSTFSEFHFSFKHRFFFFFIFPLLISGLTDY